MGKVMIDASNPVLKNARQIYIKEISSLTVTKPATPILTVNGVNIMAVSKYGKGTVFVIGDPWLYNEYTDGRRLPREYQNFTAAQDMSSWLLAQAKKGK